MPAVINDNFEIVAFSKQQFQSLVILLWGSMINFIPEICY